MPTGLLSILLTWLLPACWCRELAGPGFCRVYSWCHLILLVLFSHIKCACRNGLASSSCLEPAYSSPEYVTFRLISYPEGESGEKTSGGNCIPYEERLDKMSQFLQRWIFRKMSTLNKTPKNSHPNRYFWLRRAVVFLWTWTPSSTKENLKQPFSFEL